jgi:hypothetical protein
MVTDNKRDRLTAATDLQQSHQSSCVSANSSPDQQLQTELLAIVRAHCERTNVEDRRDPDEVRDYEHLTTVTNSSVVLPFSRYWTLNVSTSAAHVTRQSQHPDSTSHTLHRLYCDIRLGSQPYKRTKWKPKHVPYTRVVNCKNKLGTSCSIKLSYNRNQLFQFHYDVSRAVCVLVRLAGIAVWRAWRVLLFWCAWIVLLFQQELHGC